MMGKTKKQKKDYPQFKKKKKEALNTFKTGRRKGGNLDTDWNRKICRKTQAVLKHQMKTDASILSCCSLADVEEMVSSPSSRLSVALSPKDLL